MKTLNSLVLVATLLGSGAALASDDCLRPMAEWQSREAVTAHATQLGISTDRLRIDDGCYEVRGRDATGNRVELKIDPATLALLKLEVRFAPGADPARYLPGAHAQTNKAPAATGQPQRQRGER